MKTTETCHDFPKVNNRLNLLHRLLSLSHSTTTDGQSILYKNNYYLIIYFSRPSRRRDNVRITMRSPSGNDGDTAVSEVIVLSSDEEDEDTESNQQASDEELAHRIQVSGLSNSF